MTESQIVPLYYLKIIPEDEEHVPPEVSHARAVAALQAMCPGSEKCEAEAFDEIQFIDPGLNIGVVICPRCDARTSLNRLTPGDKASKWWEEINYQFNETQVEYIETPMPCCGTECQFNLLKFDPPGGFARFELSARNPGKEALTPAQMRELEKILGCPLLQIKARY
jgi:hypothetical protein